jgi:hypothetical protein
MTLKQIETQLRKAEKAAEIVGTRNPKMKQVVEALKVARELVKDELADAKAEGHGIVLHGKVDPVGTRQIQAVAGYVPPEEKQDGKGWDALRRAARTAAATAASCVRSARLNLPDETELADALGELAEGARRCASVAERAWAGRKFETLEGATRDAEHHARQASDKLEAALEDERGERREP